MIVLAALLQLDDRAYGMLVRREIERRSSRAVSIGAVYTTLNRLERKGYVSSQLGEPSPVRGGRAKRLFRIEAEGNRALLSSLRSLHRMLDGLALEWGST